MTPKKDLGHKKNIYSYDEKTLTPDKLMHEDIESPVGKFKSTNIEDFTPKKR